MVLPFNIADVSPATMELLRGLELLTGRLEQAVVTLEDTLDPDPAEPAERDTND